MEMRRTHYRAYLRLYSVVLIAACGGLLFVLSQAEKSYGPVRSAIVPAVFFAICLQSATIMLWKLQARGYKQNYDDPTSIVAMGSVVVFHQLGAVAMAIACFFVACINFSDIKNKEFTQAILKDATGILSVGSALLALYVLDFSSAESLPTFLAKVICASIVAGVVHKIISGTQQYLTSSVFASDQDEFASAFTRLIPLALFSGLIGKLYFQIDQSMLWAFAIPIVLYFFITVSFIELQAARTNALATLVKALEAKDPYTARHADRVAMFSRYMGEEFHFSKRRMERLHYAALLHDIGKLVIPNSILNKPGPLNQEEYKVLARHDAVSAELMKRIEFLTLSAQFAGPNYSSIEHMSTKYLEPHIIAVADAFDAMTSTRSYRQALTQDIALQELRNGEGKQFHPIVVEALVRALESRNEVYGAGHEVEMYYTNAPVAGVGSAGLSYSESLLLEKELHSHN